MYALPTYTTLSTTSNLARFSDQGDAVPSHKALRARPRGHDGRFVPKAVAEASIEEQTRKVCGWCLTSDTSQWRVGPTDGSAAMGTLCNACGINYRRAVVKSATGRVNLDSLARAMGPSRPSIQKALKRQMKNANLSQPSKRSRPINKFSRSRGLSAVEFCTLPSPSLSKLLCDSSPVSVEGSGDSNVYSVFPHKDLYMSPLSNATAFGEDKLWDRSPMTAVHSPSVLPPIQSLLRCVGQTSKGDSLSFRPDRNSC